MRNLSMIILPLCLLLGACAPEDRDTSAPASAAAPVALAPSAADTQATADDEHAHHHDASAGMALQRPPGGNWATDAPLRQGMETIHAALEVAIPTFEKGEMTDSAATTLAGVVTGQVQFLVANCQLEPDADAQLHILIGQMLSAAKAMVADAGSAEGVPKLHAAVQLYGDYFEHPGLHHHSGVPHHADGEHQHGDHDADPAGG